MMLTFTEDASKDPLLLSLRKELYVQDYDTINWDHHRQVCAVIDDYSPLNPIMKIAQDFLAIYEKILPYVPPLIWLRNWALKYVIAYIHEEDIQTNYVDIGPVNKIMNMLAVWIASGGDNSNIDFQKHLPRVDDYLWVAEDGMKMQVYSPQKMFYECMMIIDCMFSFLSLYCILYLFIDLHSLSHDFYLPEVCIYVKLFK